MAIDLGLAKMHQTCYVPYHAPASSCTVALVFVYTRLTLGESDAV